MNTDRLEAFSDGVIAIIITVMVLELKIPHGADLESLKPLFPVFLSYILSFIYVGIYWNNHHHMFHVTTKISGAILWANLHLLFWLSLFPFVTGWMGENHFALLPLAFYGGALFMASLAYFILQQTIISSQGEHSPSRTAVGRDLKGKISPVLYAAGILCAFFQSWLAAFFYILPAVMWMIPDRRIEQRINSLCKAP